MPIDTVDKIWMDGELVAWDDAKIHVLTHTLHYGCGVFEGIRAYETTRGPAVFRLEEHIDRLFNSAAIYMLDIPFTREELIAATVETIRVNDVPSCYIRPLVYLGYGEMGLNPLPCPVNVSIAVWPWGTYLGDEGIQQRHPPEDLVVAPPRPQHHAAGRQGHRHVHQLLHGQGRGPQGGLRRGRHALAPGQRQRVHRREHLHREAGGRSSPRPTSAGALEGITQDSVRRIAEDLGVDYRVENLLRSDLYTADEAFLSGTAAEVVPDPLGGRPRAGRPRARSPARSRRPTSPRSAARTTATRTG